MLLNLLGNPYLNSRTNLDNFKDFLLLSNIFRVMQTSIRFAAFGFFGWWYYAQSEGAPALA